MGSEDGPYGWAVGFHIDEQDGGDVWVGVEEADFFVGGGGYGDVAVCEDCGEGLEVEVV